MFVVLNIVKLILFSRMHLIMLHMLPKILLIKEVSNLRMQDVF